MGKSLKCRRDRIVNFGEIVRAKNKAKKCNNKPILKKTMGNRRTILWIHGFAGCPDNPHVKEMRKRYPEYEWYSIEVDHHAKASMEKINAYIREHDLCLVAGTSLGGYYAMCAEYAGPKLVVNPVADPVRDLRQFVGKCCYKPGRPDGQSEFEFTEEMLREFGELHYCSLRNVLCHYTAHDQVLGEGIKQDNEKMFDMREMLDEKTLPEHFMTMGFSHISSFKIQNIEMLLFSL